MLRTAVVGATALLLTASPLAYAQIALGQRSRDLKQLADAWQPLYQTLSADQRRRVALLTIAVLRRLRDRAEEPAADFYDVDEPQDAKQPFEFLQSDRRSERIRIEGVQAIDFRTAGSEASGMTLKQL